MPTFATPQPITATISLLVGDIRITASDRADTVVHVRPVSESSRADVKIAEQTRVEYADGGLTVKTPKSLGGWFTRTGAIEVTIDLPSGSHLRGDTGMGELRCDGRFGDCQFKSGYGQIHVQRAEAVRLTTGGGDLTVDSASGPAAITSGTGEVRIRHIGGAATVKNSNGSTWIGEVGGDLRVHAANGDITVDHAGSAVMAKTAHGSIRIGEVVRRSVLAETALGDIEIGIRAGTAAWLDVNTSAGSVRNELHASGSPGRAEETADIRARTSYGDITIRRSAA